VLLTLLVSPVKDSCLYVWSSNPDKRLLLCKKQLVCIPREFSAITCETGIIKWPWTNFWVSPCVVTISFLFLVCKTPGCQHRYQQWTNLFEDDVIHDLPSCRNFQKGNLIGEQSKDSQDSQSFIQVWQLWKALGFDFLTMSMHTINSEMFSTTLVSEKIMFAPFGLACLLTFELQVNTVQDVYSLSKTFRSPVALSHLPCTPRNYHVMNCNSTIQVE
jgi:hypothetical protein